MPRMVPVSLGKTGGRGQPLCLRTFRGTTKTMTEHWRPCDRSPSPASRNVPIPQDQRGSVTHPRPHSPEAGGDPRAGVLI